MPNFKKSPAGGPSAMKMYGKGKNPIMNLGFIKAETLKKDPNATTMMVDGEPMPIKMYGKSPAKMYGKKSMAKMYGKHKK